MTGTLRTIPNRALYTVSSIAALSLLASGCGNSDGNRDETGDQNLAVLNQPLNNNDPNNNDPNNNDPNNNDPNNNDPNNNDVNDDGDDTADGSEDSESYLDLPSSLPKFDIGSPKVGNDLVNFVENDFSYIWISNTEQNTVSKIDTRTLIEEGRYYVDPEKDGSPSRTSVNLSGDAAVANRFYSGITKIWAQESSCSDSNGTAGIQTSSGADDILDWGEEECIAWHTPMKQYRSQRSIAWTKDEALWVSGVLGDNSAIDVMLLDGETGKIDETVSIPSSAFNGGILQYAAYGGAVDGDGNLWFSDDADYTSTPELVRVSRKDLDYTVYAKEYVSGYGITVDSNGRVWSCGRTTERFDPETEEWEQAVTEAGSPVESDVAGCMSDSQGILWVSAAGPSALTGIDIESMEQVYQWEVPDGRPKGISIDFDGYVWAVLTNGTTAHKVDPDTGDIESYKGLTGAYTYSDMTGFALQTAGTLTPIK